MTNSLDQEKILAGKDWAEAEMRALAIEYSVRIKAINWTESTEASVWIATLNSSAGEHTIALPYTALGSSVSSDNGRFMLRERLRGLIGDLARIERRGYLR